MAIETIAIVERPSIPEKQLPTITHPMQNFDLGFDLDGSSSTNSSSPLKIINTTGFHQTIMATSQHHQLQQASAAPSASAYSHNMAAPVSSESSLNSARSSGSVSSHLSSHLNSTSPVPAPTGAMAMTAGASYPAQTSSSQQLLPQQTLSSLQPQQQQQVAPPQHVVSNNGSLLYNNIAAAQQTAVQTAAPTTNSILGTTSSLYGTVLPTLPLAAATAAITGGSVPEFLYQLTKMLTDNNRDIIEWSTYSGNGRIEVHHPARLESEVLGRYFRHSKYSSFQRQLNYFGFRKIAGKGKMSPCSYVNEAATTDIRSLLLMKRKNSKEKQAELDAAAAKKAAEEAKNGSSSGRTTRSSNKRPNPGDNIQPATVQPMFSGASALSNQAGGAVPSSGASVTSTTSAATLSSHASFNTMAANIARNISGATPNNVNSNNHVNMGISANVASAAAALAANKRAKLSNSSGATSSTSSEGRGYTVAIGKGVRHQLNGYLRSAPNTTTIANASKSNLASATTATSSTASTNTSSTSTYSSYLSHPAARQASSAPAPLQFLDPSELGMSIENSLSQLKNNFAAASATNNGTASSVAGTTVASESSTTAAPTSSSATGSTANSSSSNNKPQQPSASALTRRVSSTTFLGGMLSRDDSLINLAMLPTLDSSVALSSLGTTTTGDSTANEYMTGIFARDDSLVNLAAGMDQAGNSSAAPASDSATGNSNGATQEGEGGESPVGLEW